MRVRTKQEFASDRFNADQLDKLRDLLMEEHEFFYHCTNAGNAKHIQDIGLQPDKADPDMLAYGAPKGLCFCTKQALHSTYRMVLAEINYDTDGLKDLEAVIFAIPAQVILSKSFGLDWSASQTFNHTNDYYHTDRECELTPHQAIETIARCGFLVCYDVIEPFDITVIKLP